VPTLLEVKVIPQARQSAISIDKGGSLRIHLKSVPEKGKANQELIQVIAKTLRIPLSDVTIVAGFLSRNKKISIEGIDLTVQEIIDKLVPGQQQRLF
jgi:uncharacterized protein (TIGR00251 family)